MYAHNHFIAFKKAVSACSKHSHLATRAIFVTTNGVAFTLRGRHRQGRQNSAENLVHRRRDRPQVRRATDCWAPASAVCAPILAYCIPVKFENSKFHVGICLRSEPSCQTYFSSLCLFLSLVYLHRASEVSPLRLPPSRYPDRLLLPLQFERLLP